MSLGAAKNSPSNCNLSTESRCAPHRYDADGTNGSQIKRSIISEYEENVAALKREVGHLAMGISVLRAPRPDLGELGGGSLVIISPITIPFENVKHDRATQK